MNSKAHSLAEDFTHKFIEIYKRADELQDQLFPLIKALNTQVNAYGAILFEEDITIQYNSYSDTGEATIATLVVEFYDLFTDEAYADTLHNLRENLRAKKQRKDEQDILEKEKFRAYNEKLERELLKELKEKYENS